jgi:hemoglobin
VSEVSEDKSLYEIAGPEFFVRLVDRFYDGIETDQVLLPLYPEGSDTVAARQRLALFLIQYWGGPDTYMQERGHPRLRMRHAPFVIGALERDHWLMHMAAAIEQTIPEVDEAYREHVTTELANYMVNAAEAMRNV